MAHLTKGERFAEARTTFNQHGNQSQRKVEAETGVSHTMIRDIENDEDRRVNYVDVLTLAKHYGVSLDYLLDVSEEPQIKKSAVDELGISPNFVRWMTLLKDASDNDDFYAEYYSEVNAILGLFQFRNLTISLSQYNIAVRASAIYTQIANTLFEKTHDSLFCGAVSQNPTTEEVYNLLHKEIEAKIRSEKYSQQLIDALHKEERMLFGKKDVHSDKYRLDETDIHLSDIHYAELIKRLNRLVEVIKRQELRDDYLRNWDPDVKDWV